MGGYVFFVALISLFFPLGAFFLAVGSLILLSSSIPTLFRYFLGLIALFTLLVIIGSRTYIDELEHDLAHYFAVYQSLHTGNYNEIWGFGDGIEIGWPLIYLIQGKLFSQFNNPIHLSLFNTGLCLLLLFLWVESKLLLTVVKRDRSLVLGLIILFLLVTTLGYLQRQALAIVIALFALTASNKKRTILFTILAGLFHISAVPTIITYRYLLKKKISRSVFLIIAVGLLGFRFLFMDIIILILSSGIDFPGIHKLHYYFVTQGTFMIASLRFAVLELGLIAILLIRWKYICSPWKNVAAFTAICYLALLGLPLLSERLNFIVLVLYGFFFYIALESSSRKSFNVLFCKGIGLLYLVLFCIERSGLFIDVLDPYWQRYEQISIYLAQYLI